MGGRASSMERKRQSSEYVAERGADGGLTEVLWKVVHGCNI